MNRRNAKMVNDMKLKMKLVERKLKRLPVVGKIALGASLLLSALLYVGAFLYFMSVSLHDRNIWEVDKCPACYGQSLCKHFKTGDYIFEGLSKFKFFHLINVKNVHFATHKEKRIVLKKLGHKSELKGVDDQLCKQAGYDTGCNIADSAMSVSR